MREYEDPQTHFDHFIGKAAGRYVDGLAKAGMRPSETLTKAMAERAVQDAKRDLKEHHRTTFEHNLAYIQEQHKARMKQIDRDGARMARWLCPVITIGFGLIGWFHPDPIMKLIYWSGALAFLAMLLVLLWRAR